MNRNASNWFDVLDMLLALWTGATVLLGASHAVRGGAIFGKDAAGTTLAILGVLAVVGVSAALAYRSLSARLPRPWVTAILGVVALALVPVFVWAMPTVVIVI